jgi:hypothetical protein
MNNNKIHPKTRKYKDEVARHLVTLEKAGHLSKISYQGMLDYISSLTAKLGSIALL